MSAPRPGVLRIAAALAGAALLAMLLFHPLREARPYADDHAFIALARHLEHPWALLFQDVFGQFYFRPLALAFWWLSVTALGNGPAQYFVDVLLHLAASALLFAWLRRLAIGAPVALLWAAVFAAHPTAFATLAWLSNRFDLLVAIAGLGALLATSRFRERPSVGNAAATILCALAAMLSKETGFAFPLLCIAVLALPTPGGTGAHLSSRIALGLGLIASSAAVLGARSLVLRDTASSMFFAEGLVATLAQGLARLARFSFDYLAPHVGNTLGFGVWLAFLAVVVVGGMAGIARRRLDFPLATAILVGLGLVLLAALAQAPVARLSPIVPFRFGEHRLDAGQFEILVANRFFYLPLLGACMALAAFTEVLHRATASIARFRKVLGLSIFAAVVIALAAGARAVGRDWAEFTRRQDGALMDAAVAAVAQARDLAPGCKIFLLDTKAYSTTFVYGADVMVKQGLPAGHAAAGCFIQAEAAPWFYLVDHRRHAAGAIAPLQMISFQGKPYAPVRVGNLSTFFLTVPEDDAVRRDPAARFLAYDGRVFRDVTPEVQDGTRIPRFYDNRTPR